MNVPTIAAPATNGKRPSVLNRHGVLRSPRSLTLRRDFRRHLARVVVPVALAASGCASLDQAAVGRTDRLAGAPFYVTYARSNPSGPTIVLPITVDAASAEPFNMAGREKALQPLLDALNDALAAHNCCRFVGAAALPRQAGPVAYLGMLDGDNAPPGTGLEQADYEEYSPMILHVLKPGAQWQTAAAAIAAENNASRILVVQLAFTQFPKADRGYFGKKVVLGTGYEVPVRFFSAVDKPIEVIALTGILLDARGGLLRAGGEGIIGYDAPFWVQVFEAGKDIDNQAVERLVTKERRDDLPGQPLNWQAALEQLLRQMTTAP